MKYTKAIVPFIGGILLTLIVVLSLKTCNPGPKTEVNTDYYVISNQIRKMNKMVVMEQDFSSIQKTKMSTEILGGGLFPSMDKEIVTYTKTNAQVSYNLSQMQLKVDSTNRQLIIEVLPQAEIKITPSVEITSMDDSFFNRIEQKDLQKIQKSAKDNAIKTVNRERLLKESKGQLLDNLNQIFVLAKALNYEVIDKTGQIDLSQL